MPAHPSGFNRLLLRRFALLARLYWQGEERARAYGLLAVLILLLLCQTGFNVMFNQESGELASALAAGHAERFWSAIRRFTWILVAALPIWGLYYFVRDTLGLRWRRWLTRHLLARYFSQHAYYRLNAVAGLDNPDQRIAEDINSFTQQSLYFLMIGLGALIQLIAFSQVLWAISHTLVYFLVGYAVLGNWFTGAVFGPRLIALNFAQLKKEADFRFGLVRVREQAEPIAFHGGEAHEMGRLQAVFERLFDNARQILQSQLRLNLFQYGHSFLTLVLPSLIIANDVLSGQLEVGRAIQAGGAFAAILSAMTVIVEHFEGLSRFSAGVNRLDAFAQTLDLGALAAPADGLTAAADTRSAGPGSDGASASDPCAAGKPTPGIATHADPQLSLRNLTVCTPGGEHRVVQGLTVDVAAGEGLLIVGPSGCGKSSLLRAIAGLWTQGAGDVRRPGGDELMFLPQQPYFALGDLRCQLLYPDTGRDVSDEELLQWLRQVALPDLAQRVGGLGAERDWAKLLSVGEQQRLAFARALIGRPRYLVLDEASSALDAANQAALYDQLAGLSITPISVSHRAALLPYHRWVLVLDGQGGWSRHAAAGFVFEH